MRVKLPNVPRWWWKLGEADALPVDAAGFLRESHGGKTLDELADAPCLVLLGDAGFGKSTAVHLTRTALEARGEKCSVRQMGAADVDVRECITEALAVAKTGATHHLFLDGYDEIATNLRGVGKTISDALLSDLDALQRLRLRVVCRAAALPERLPELLGHAYGKEQVALYTLLPLRVPDVEALVRAARPADEASVLSRLTTPPLAALATRPITLRLLLESRITVTGTTTAYEVYDGAIESLLVEHDDERREMAPVAIERRRQIAETLAVVTLLGGRPGVVADVVRRSAPVDAVTSADLDGITSPDELGELLLSAPLFKRDDGGPSRFAHRSYAEFLAAEQLARHPRPDEVVARLFMPEGVTTRVVPQLRGLAAWLGARRRFFDRLVARDPITLLDVDHVFVDAVQKKRLVDDALRRSEDLHTPGYLGGERLARFDHPGLADQLRAWIFDVDASDHAREVAIAVAMATRCDALAGMLADVAVSGRHPIPVRVYAARAVRELGNEDSIRALCPLIGDCDEDANGDLKGIALDALWPRWLDTTTMFGALTRPKNEHHFGAYSSFFWDALPRYLSRDAVPLALRWCAANFDPHSIWRPDRLLKRALALAVENLGNEAISRALVEYVLASVRVHGEPMRQLVEALKGAGDAARRWALLDLLVPHCDASNDGRLLRWPLRHLVNPEDAHALLDRAAVATSPIEALTWVRLAEEQHLRASESDPTITVRLFAYHSAPEETPARKYLSWLWEPVPIDDDNARFHREQRRRELLAEEKSEKAALARQQRAHRIDELSERAIRGELDAFWLAISWINTRVRDDSLVEQWHQIRLATSDDWTAMDAERQRAFLAAAVEYLVQSDPEVEAWFGKNLMHWPAVAGRQAFVLLVERDAPSLDALEPYVWERWLPALLSPPWTPMEASPDVVAQLLHRGYAAASSSYRARALELLSVETKEFPAVIPPVMDVITPVLDSPFVDELRRLAETTAISSEAFWGIASGIARHDPALAVSIAREVAPRDWGASDDVGKRAMRAAALLLEFDPEGAWPLLQPLFECTPERGAEAVQAVEGRARAGAQWSPSFTSARAMASFFSWGSRVLPTLSRGGGRDALVRPHDVLGWTLPRLLERLISLGTQEALVEVEALQRAMPVDERVRHAVMFAKEQYLEQSWRGWPIDDLLATFSALRRRERP